MILPENLQEIDTTMLAVPYGTGDAGVPVQKFRDGLKVLHGMTDGNAAYCVLGVEGQVSVHYAVPVKNGLYDFQHLSEQVERAAKSHERQRKAAKEDKNKDQKKEEKVVYRPSGAEYLSGFWRSDRLLPVITVVVYWNAQEWDGPLSLREMYVTQDEDIIKHAPDYRVNLIAPYHMSDEEIDWFRTNMREVMLYIKYSKDKEKLAELIQEDDRFHEVEREAVEVINQVTNSKLKYPKGKEKIDMCQAILEMREESERIGEERMRKKMNSCQAIREIREESERIGEERMRKKMNSCQAILEMREESERIGEARGITIGEARGITIGEERMKARAEKAEARVRELEDILARQRNEKEEGL